MRVNKRIVFRLLLAILVLSSLAVLGQQPKRVLTNDDVIKMVKEGLPDNVIVSTIQQFPANYDVSPDALIQMKRQGASGIVLTAVLEAERVKNSKPTDITISSESKTPQKMEPVIRHDFVFELDVCQSSGGDSVTCWFFITNKASERSLSITLSSHIDENLDGRSQATDVWIANRGRERALGGFQNFASNTLKLNTRLAAVLKFQNVNPKATLIRVLRIVCSLDNNDFHVDFPNVPITQKPQPPATPKAEPQQEKQNDRKGSGPIRIPSESTNESVDFLTFDATTGTVTRSDGKPIDISSILDPVKGIQLPFKYRVKHFSFPDPREGLDLCAGTITLGKDHLEIITNSDKSALGFKCDSNTYQLTKDDVQKLKDTLDSKWYDYRPTADYLYMKFAVVDKNGKDKKKKELYLYPAEASIQYGTRTHTLTGKVLVCPKCPAIVCRDCKEDLVTMKNLLDEFHGKRKPTSGSKRIVYD